MSMELLDKNGLAYFWGKIKSYVAGLLSSKADDSDVVHKAGDESVTGTKTFTSIISGSINGNANTANSLTASEPPSDNSKPIETQPINTVRHYEGNRDYTANTPEAGTYAAGTSVLFGWAQWDGTNENWTRGFWLYGKWNISGLWYGQRPYTSSATIIWKKIAFEDSNITGNAATASSAAKLTTARKINGVSFDGSADVTLTAVVSSASRSADIAANGTFTVPSYIVGAQALLVYLDGCLSRQGDGWDEVGTAGTASTTIKFLQLIPKAMEIVVRVN